MPPESGWLVRKGCPAPRREWTTVVLANERRPVVVTATSSRPVGSGLAGTTRELIEVAGAAGSCRSGSHVQPASVLTATVRASAR